MWAILVEWRKGLNAERQERRGSWNSQTPIPVVPGLTVSIRSQPPSTGRHPAMQTKPLYHFLHYEHYERSAYTRLRIPFTSGRILTWRLSIRARGTSHAQPQP